MTRPTREHQNSVMPVKERSPTLSTVSMPTTQLVANQIAGIDRTAAAITPLYIAHMMLPSEPRRTKKVPMIEVMMQTPPMTSG